MEYNTLRTGLTMREYGRHIQQMVDYLLTIEDPERRQKNAYALIELMGFLNPHLRNVEDFRHKLWDHLFLISDFKLEVESPYPIPTRETLKTKPERLPYPKRYPKFNHLGKNIETVINKALSEEDADKRQGFANAIAYYMKLAYSNWHHELVHDDSIQAELSNLTQGQLEFNNRPFVKHRASPEREDFISNVGKPRHKQHYSQNNRGTNGNRSNNGNRGGNGNRPGGSRDGNNRGNGAGGNNRFNKKRFK
ncbi:DUF4290 domain-containing protein [Dinghuibacter silviterrae]|uniref:Uncharacterized protein DUF4290 n=1 Tax=Dinghuibacter silviterrae TaxID=1539049 RepID=A0A4R8DRB0_9BACT|nr:DUF4290 domain-containing protein [Dinghuibacter silviterrae]TDW99876.1 uncharacterized protein DUF4290 [Dinghuibacter silviterrae]